MLELAKKPKYTALDTADTKLSKLADGGDTVEIYVKEGDSSGNKTNSQKELTVVSHQSTVSAVGPCSNPLITRFPENNGLLQNLPKYNDMNVYAACANGELPLVFMLMFQMGENNINPLTADESGNSLMHYVALAPVQEACEILKYLLDWKFSVRHSCLCPVCRAACFDSLVAIIVGSARYL
eukprot:277937_1